MFTKRQKIQLPAAILTSFLCALTVFCVNVHHFPLIVSVGIPSLGRSELIFIDPGIKITGTRYCCNIFCQPFVQYLDLSSRFNKTMPRLTVLTNSCTAADGRDAGLRRAVAAAVLATKQPGSISIRLTIRYLGHFATASVQWHVPDH